MRFRLRTLLIVLALGPPVLAICFLAFVQRPARQRGQQGHWIYQAKFIGNRLYTDKKLAKVIGLINTNGIKGWRLNADSAEDSRKRIEHLYHQAGYLKASVSVAAGGKIGEKELIFEIREGSQIARAVP